MQPGRSASPLWPLLVALLGIVVYANAPSNGFALDDLQLVRDDPRIRSLGGIPRLFVEPYWYEGGRAAGLYRPVTLASLALDRAVTGPGPMGFHLMNVLLHGVVCAFVWAAARRAGTWYGTALLAGALPAVATADGAYARLLRAHVRPGEVGGIRLNLVDYRAVKADPAYAEALAVLAGARVEALRGDAEREAFWINAYNLLAIKAVLDQYPTGSIKDGGSLFSPIWKKSIGGVGGTPHSLDAIEHGILRKAFREPRVHFAIVCASLSCPDLRPEPFAAARLGAQLDEQAAAFLGNPTKGLVPGADGRTARVSSIFKWFAGDFESSGGVAAFIRAKAASDVAARIRTLTDAGLSYLDYDWSLNDTARASS
jgi:hypothetical protein